MHAVNPEQLDKIQGSLLGGAIGDALGYSIEFDREEEIFRRYGPAGITRLETRGGKALVSDDTQMSLFTANGLLKEGICSQWEERKPDYPASLKEAYQAWYQTQRSVPKNNATPFWLMGISDLYSQRAPGLTCLSAIEMGCGSLEEPLNHSKGCGGVMRVAPVGLLRSGEERNPAFTARLSAQAAALSHGHPLGWLPAAMLSVMVEDLVYGTDMDMKKAARHALEVITEEFADTPCLKDFQKLISRAVRLADMDVPDLIAIHELGEGWVGEEALAIGLYCALKYASNFTAGIQAAVNHNGDSDSTGSIAGNLLGAWLGLSQIPQEYLEPLELKETLLLMGKDLEKGIPERKEIPQMEPDWQKRYGIQ